jgi:hypothetical protein
VAALHHALSCEIRQGVTRRHQAHPVRFREISLRINHISRLQLAGVDPFPNGILDSLVSRLSASMVGSCHELSRA